MISKEDLLSSTALAWLSKRPCHPAYVRLDSSSTVEGGASRSKLLSCSREHLALIASCPSAYLDSNCSLIHEVSIDYWDKTRIGCQTHHRSRSNIVGESFVVKSRRLRSCGGQRISCLRPHVWGHHVERVSISIPFYHYALSNTFYRPHGLTRNKVINSVLWFKSKGRMWIRWQSFKYFWTSADTLILIFWVTTWNL